MRPVQVVIPVGPYHKGLAGDAIASAKAQTIPCEVVVIEDTQGRGAGWARNQGWRQGTDCSPFTVFLDADDLLAPTFVEQTLASYQPGFFVYTDWYDHQGRRVELPDRTDQSGWYQGTRFHLVTTLMPTALLQTIGGFDETLSSHEDNELYLRLRLHGVCGLRCPEPLVTYRRDLGRRARTSFENGESERILSELHVKYGDVMGCGCAGGGIKSSAPQNEQQAGDVLAMSLLPYNRSVRGFATARRYFAMPGAKLWVNAEDVKLDPTHWQLVFDPVDIVPSTEDVLAMANEALRT